MDASLHCSNAFIFFFYLFMTVIKESVIFNKDSHWMGAQTGRVSHLEMVS